MKNYFYIVILLLIFSACTKPEAEQTPMGDLTIRIDAGATVAGESFSSLLVSMYNGDSSVVLVHEQLAVSLTDSGYVSDRLHLPLGKYSLQGIVIQNHRGESVYFAPKNGSVASIVSGKAMPATINCATIQTNIDIPAVSPRKMGLQPADCGYTDFPNWNKVPTPIAPLNKMRCVRIGAGAGSVIGIPIAFTLFADDSLVLRGKCSGGVTEFDVPDARVGYRVVVKNPHDEDEDIVQHFTLAQMILFSCTSPGARYIDLRIGLPVIPIPPKPEIVFIRQEFVMGNTLAQLSLMDTNGNVYKVPSTVLLNDSMGKAIFVIDSTTYHTYQSYMVAPVSICNKDSVTYYQTQFPLIERELAKHYVQSGKLLPVKMYAVQQLPDGRSRALLIDANGPPKGVWWDISDSFLPVLWLRNNNF